MGKKLHCKVNLMQLLPPISPPVAVCFAVTLHISHPQIVASGRWEFGGFARGH